MATKEEIIEKLKTIYDPEIYIDIWTLGLIYDIAFNDASVDIRMTFTSVACPVGPELVGQVKSKLCELQGVETVNVEVVFDPPWQPSDDLKASMGIL